MELYARQNDDGVSINESALCALCMRLEDDIIASYAAWADAEDVTGHADSDSRLYPIDNEDAVCIGCGANATVR